MLDQDLNAVSGLSNDLYRNMHLDRKPLSDSKTGSGSVRVSHHIRGTYYDVLDGCLMRLVVVGFNVVHRARTGKQRTDLVKEGKRMDDPSGRDLMFGYQEQKSRPINTLMLT